MERYKLYAALFATSFFLNTCVPPRFHPLFSGLLPTPTPTKEPLNIAIAIIPKPTYTPTPEATPTPSTIRNGLTGAIYRRTGNPEGKSGECVILDQYTDANKQDVVGAATALGPDPSRYNDHHNFIVYMPDHKVLGTFTTDTIAPQYPFGDVPPGTIICED